MSMALRVWPQETLLPETAQSRLRLSFLDAVQGYAASHAVPSFKKVLDVGCSVGVSTFHLAKYFQSALSIEGLDLSPHFLAVAQHRVRNQEQTEFAQAGLNRIKWVHGNAESTEYDNGAFDLVTGKTSYMYMLKHLFVHMHMLFAFCRLGLFVSLMLQTTSQ